MADLPDPPAQPTHPDDACQNTVPVSWNSWGFAVVEGGMTETSGAFGHEAVVTYMGPAANRYEFLDEMFGKWNKAMEWELEKAPTPLCGNIWSLIPKEHYCAWPETYNISPYCGNPTAEIYLDSESPSYSRGCLGVQSGDCVNIAITYRPKDPGPFPPTQACWCAFGASQPTVPAGTLIECKTTRDFSVVNTPGGSWRDACPNLQGDRLKTSAGFPIHVLTTKHDVIWSNVPEVNEVFLEQTSGKLNKSTFLGYPPESVLFVYRGSTRKARWDCTAVYDVKFQLIVKTEILDDCLVEDTQCESCLNDQATPKHWPRIGLWNRAWFPTRIDPCGGVDGTGQDIEDCTEFCVDGTPGGGTCWTNWHPVVGVCSTECVGGKVRPFKKTDDIGANLLVNAMTCFGAS